jgi:Ran GTPase-activating protein (RanGAP) involved in mRNA processing and transport
LNKNRVLTSIELNDNSIGDDDGCTAMAAVLQENTAPGKASLNGNRISPVDAVALAETLWINTGLRDLGLGRNYVRNEGAAAIAGALRCNTTLERLDLSSNRISDAGAMAIRKALTESNRSLAWLDLEHNAVVSRGLRKDIDFMLASRRVLKTFCHCLYKPLDKKLMPMAIRVVQQSSRNGGWTYISSGEVSSLGNRISDVGMEALGPKP